MTFADPAEHLKAELQRLDLLLHREIVRLRAAYQLSLDEFRGLYVSDEQVDRLAGNALLEPARGGDVDGAKQVGDLTARAEALRRENETRIGPDLPWSRVVSEWGLSPFERDVLLPG